MSASAPAGFRLDKKLSDCRRYAGFDFGWPWRLWPCSQFSSMRACLRALLVCVPADSTIVTGHVRGPLRARSPSSRRAIAFRAHRGNRSVDSRPPSPESDGPAGQSGRFLSGAEAAALTCACRCRAVTGRMLAPLSSWGREFGSRGFPPCHPPRRARRFWRRLRLDVAGRDQERVFGRHVGLCQACSASVRLLQSAGSASYASRVNRGRIVEPARIQDHRGIVGRALDLASCLRLHSRC